MGPCGSSLALGLDAERAGVAVGADVPTLEVSCQVRVRSASCSLRRYSAYSDDSLAGAGALNEGKTTFGVGAGALTGGGWTAGGLSGIAAAGFAVAGACDLAVGTSDFVPGATCGSEPSASPLAANKSAAVARIMGDLMELLLLNPGSLTRRSGWIVRIDLRTARIFGIDRRLRRRRCGRGGIFVGTGLGSRDLA